MNQQEFWDEHIITHKLVRIYPDKEITIGVGSINMRKRYVAENPNAKIIIMEL